MKAPKTARKRPRHLRRIRKLTKRWGRKIAVQLGLKPPPADRGYIICCTPRSGSGYFCQLLSSTGVLGKPREYFNADSRRQETPDYPREPKKQIKILQVAGATPNGIYGVKILALQYHRIKDRVDVFGGLPRPSVVRLERNDVLGQAISWTRARQTNQFASVGAAKGQAHYDTDTIRTNLLALQDLRAKWDEVMVQLGAEPLRFDYQDIVDGPQRAVDLVAAMMGLSAPTPIDPQLVTFKQQRDEISAEWRTRFLAETGGEFNHLSY